MLGLVVGGGNGVVGNSVVGDTVVGNAVGNTMDSVDGGDVVLDHGLVVGGAVVGHSVGGVVGRVGHHRGVHSVGERGVGDGANIVVDEGGDSGLIHWSLLGWEG